MYRHTYVSNSFKHFYTLHALVYTHIHTYAHNYICNRFKKKMKECMCNIRKRLRERLSLLCKCIDTLRVSHQRIRKFIKEKEVNFTCQSHRISSFYRFFSLSFHLPNRYVYLYIKLNS